ncbi:unnamed protein product [Withania somnifera]
MGESIFCFRKCRLGRVMGCIQFVLGSLVILVSLSSLFRFYSAGFFMHDEDICRHFYGVKDVYDSFDIKALSSRVDEVLDKMESLQDKIEGIVQEMEKNKDELEKGSIPKLEYKRFLEEEVIKPLYTAHIALRQIRLPRIEGIGNVTIKEDPLINNFVIEEIRKYITPKENRHKKVNIFGTQKIYNTIGHACVSMKKELEEYMDYDIGSYYGRNVRWSNYLCGNYKCLSSKNPNRGFNKCIGCFDMEKEELKWITNSSLTCGFLDQRCIDAPFGETIALRGLIPLYVTLNQRLPFFDNTMDLIHTAGFMDGWIDLQLLDFILFDWDRVLRPGGLLWIDRFFCNRTDLDDFMYMFLQFRYKKHKWAIAPKAKDEVYLSALLEKPPRSL